MQQEQLEGMVRDLIPRVQTLEKEIRELKKTKPGDAPGDTVLGRQLKPQPDAPRAQAETATPATSTRA